MEKAPHLIASPREKARPWNWIEYKLPKERPMHRRLSGLFRCRHPTAQKDASHIIAPLAEMCRILKRREQPVGEIIHAQAASGTFCCKQPLERIGALPISMQASMHGHVGTAIDLPALHGTKKIN